jgi:hypothetical protein
MYITALKWGISYPYGTYIRGRSSLGLVKGFSEDDMHEYERGMRKH